MNQSYRSVRVSFSLVILMHSAACFLNPSSCTGRTVKCAKTSKAMNPPGNPQSFRKIDVTVITTKHEEVLTSSAAPKAQIFLCDMQMVRYAAVRENVVP